ncbi:hypothetical protein C8Q73DRAFT_716698 [Cubamyces lactineus]|nr:hypothetical protein C8Q73DRAFT_716698 [Cubamyces lactineus]
MAVRTVFRTKLMPMLLILRGAAIQYSAEDLTRCQANAERCAGILGRLCQAHLPARNAQRGFGAGFMAAQPIVHLGACRESSPEGPTPASMGPPAWRMVSA